MRKKLISLISVCAMLATVAIGVVSTTYAFDDYEGVVSAVYNSDASSDTSKIVEIYYDKEEDGISGFQADITTDYPDAVVSVSMPEAASTPTWEQSNLQYMNLDGGSDFTDKKLVIITITIPEKNSVAFDLTIANIQIMDGADDFAEADDIVVTIPAATADVEPVEAALESVTGADEPIITGYKGETMTVDLAGTADIFKITATANDYNTGAITGLTVSVEGNEKNVDTAIAANDNVVIAVVIGYKDGVSKGFKPIVTANVE